MMHFERKNKGHFAEITFIGINTADIKEHKKINNILNVTVILLQK